MKKISEKIIISDNLNVVQPHKYSENINFNEKLNNYKKHVFLNEELKFCNNGLKNNSEVLLYDYLSHFDKGLNKTEISYNGIDKVALKTAVNTKDKEDYVCVSKISVSVNSDLNKINTLEQNISEKIYLSDNYSNNEIEYTNFSISDSVKIIDNSNSIEEINLMCKDYVELKSKGEIKYSVNGVKHSPVGEMVDDKFRWYLNYDFLSPKNVNIEYFYKDINFKTNKLSSTQNICLIYSKGNIENVDIKKMNVELLPISLDGTPIQKVKIDLCQNFINPIQIKYNFNPLYVYGEKNIINNGILMHFSSDSISRGKISFNHPSYIRTISYNGRYSLPFSSIYEYNTIYNTDSIYSINNNKYVGKILPFKSQNDNYRFDEIVLSNDSGFECSEYMWEIKGKGDWRNILIVIDNENGCNFGNENKIEGISYRYDGYMGWEGTDKSGEYIEFVDNVSGTIELEDNHEWGIGESDGIIEYSIDNGDTWKLELRGMIGSKLMWRSIGKISYLIIWKTNNKEIFYSNSGIVNLDCEKFGGICFERGKSLKVKINDNDFGINIINGDEITGESITNLEWEYDGEKIIFVKDLREKIVLETEDIENNGLHYGRIGLFTTENGKSSCNLYRYLGCSKDMLNEISCNPIFSWKCKEDLSVVDFREIESDNIKYRCGKIRLDYCFDNVGSFSNEYVFDSNGKELNNIGFVEYREYRGINDIEIQKGEVISVFVYDSDGNELVFPYEIIHGDKFNKIRFYHFEYIKDELKVVVLYNTYNWSETRFRVGLKKYDVKDKENSIVELNDVPNPLKAFLYNSSNNELQFPIKIVGNSIFIDLSDSDKSMYNSLKRVVILVGIENNKNAVVCQKFDSLNEKVKTYFNPVASIYEGKFLPNRIIPDTHTVETEFPFYVKDSLQYVICEYYDYCNESLLSKIWFDTTRKFNSHNNNFKSFICSSDDLKFWCDWKEFNEEFDLCNVGKYFKLKIESFTIKKSKEKINDFYFAFENLSLVKVNDNKFYFSPIRELEKNKVYIMRIKSYNGIKYSDWSKLNCYITDGNELNEGAKNLLVTASNQDRVVNKVEFNWEGNQNILTSDNLTTVSGNVRKVDDFIKGKNYIWKVKDINSKNSEGRFSINIKPPTPTVE